MLSEVVVNARKEELLTASEHGSRVDSVGLSVRQSREN